MTDQIKPYLRAALAEHANCQPDTVMLDQSLLHLDSLDMVAIEIAIEDGENLLVAEGAMDDANVVTVRDLVRFAERLVAARGGRHG